MYLSTNHQVCDNSNNTETRLCLWYFRFINLLCYEIVVTSSHKHRQSKLLSYSDAIY